LSGFSVFSVANKDVIFYLNMALTEKEKKHIEEEEAYRAKLQEEAQHGKQTTPKAKKGMSGCLIVFLLFSAFIAVIFIVVNPVKQLEEAEQKAEQVRTDVIGKHAYNKISGAYQGEVLEVKPCNTISELTCYVVNQPAFMRPIEVPVDNSIVKDEAPSEQP
jgi:hypothetical protein